MAFWQVLVTFGIVLSAIALYRPNILFAILAAGGWAVVLAVYLTDRPTAITQGSSADNMAIVVLAMCIVAIPLWVLQQDRMRRRPGAKESSNGQYYMPNTTTEKSPMDMTPSEYRAYNRSLTRRGASRRRH